MSENVELPSVTIRDIKFKTERDKDIFLAELMVFLGDRLEEYECEHLGV